MKVQYNFGAGPAILPRSILLDVQSELLDWNEQGLSILEIGHRTPPFTQLMEKAEETLRELLLIPDNYSVLFLGGAARNNFAMLPMNLITPTQSAAYWISGVWSQMAYAECVKLSRAYCVGSSEKDKFTHVPHILTQSLQDNTSYVYYTPNETVNGTRFATLPEHGNFPLVADMTSCLLSEPIFYVVYSIHYQAHS